MTDRSPAPTPWLDAFVDVPVAAAEGFRAFWSAVTGWPVSTSRGDRGQFRSLLPAQGRAYLRVQELDGPPRVHLDLICPGDRDHLLGEAERLAALGAARVDSLDGVEILTSPAGQVFCLVYDDETRPPLAAGSLARRWPGGHRSRPTQLCLDVPPAAYDAELEFWSGATGWVRRPMSYPEYTYLRHPDVDAAPPLGLLVQRLARDDDAVGAHIDLGTDDQPAEVDRLLALGAVEMRVDLPWRVLTDPVLGLPLCVTDAPP